MENNPSLKIYRVSKKDQWIVPISALFLSIIAVYFIMQEDYFFVFCLPVLLVGGLVNAVFLWQTRIEINDAGLYAQKGPRRGIKLAWHDILLAEHIQDGRKINLMRLGTTVGVYDIDLSNFDVDEIWHQIEKYVAPEALDDEAYKNLPAYQAWLSEKERLLYHIEKPLQVKYQISTQMVMLVILLVVVFIGALIFITLEGVARSPVAWVFWGILVFGVGFGFLSSVTIKLEMNSQKIMFTNLWRKKEMTWQEVKAIENNSGKRRLIFYGQDKTLKVVRPQMWHGKNVQDMLNMITAQTEYRNIQWVD